MTTIQEHSSAQETRFLAEVYAFFSLCMRFPEPSFCTNDFMETYLFFLHQLRLQEEEKEMREWLDTRPEFLEPLQIEYTRLFINDVPRVTAPPFASVYLGDDHSLQTRHTERIRQFYREHGYDITDPSIPADHVQYQLDFLSALTGEGKTDAEEEFLIRFFRPWFPDFAHAVRVNTEIPFYRISVQLIETFTKEDL